MLDWRVRQADAADAALLSLVANAAFLDTYAPSLDGGDLLAHCLKNNSVDVFTRWLADAASVVTVAELAPGYAPVGYAVLTAPDFPIDRLPGDIELRRIYTLRQVYGSGVGGALMERALADARACDGKRLLLGVWEHNVRARTFYERQGFSVIGSREFVVGGEVHVDPVYALEL
jgi:ribosomal protein S18 acetylase RimI-like enzyme